MSIASETHETVRAGRARRSYTMLFARDPPRKALHGIRPPRAPTYREWLQTHRHTDTHTESPCLLSMLMLMSPDDVRAAARAARQHRQDQAPSQVCHAFAIIAAEGTSARARLDDSLLAASERTRKRRLEAMEAEVVPVQQNVNVDANVDASDVDAASASQEDDLLAFLGV